MTTLFLIRHGKYESPNGVIPFRLPGFHLAQEGKEMIQKLRDRLKVEPITAIYTSPLERTHETATILGEPHNLVPHIEERLMETRSPAQGMTLEEVEKIHPFEWTLHDTDWWKDNGGESMDEIFARIMAAVEEKVERHKDGTFIMVTHAGPAMILIAHLLGLPRLTTELMKLPLVPMGGGYKIEMENGQATVTPLHAT